MKRKTMLITGATGFLGSFITRQLFEAGFNLILLIRNSNQVRARDRISEVFPSFEDAKTELMSRKLSDRVEIAEGDISQKHFGLQAMEYSRISDAVDEVFHCAAATKFHHESDHMLMQTNVYGTEHLAWFCLSGKRKKLHYISTAYVAGTRRDTVFEHELVKNQTFNNNYEKSKFDAEKLLRQFTAKYNIPATVYRPSIIIGDSRTGVTRNYDNIHVFGRGLHRLKNYETQKSNKDTPRSCKKSAGYPPALRIPGDKHATINLVPVDYVTQAIVAISGQEQSVNKTFQIVNPSPPTLGELAEWMTVATGIHRVSIVPRYEFQMQPETLEEKLFLKGTETFQPYMFGEPYFDSTSTRTMLSGTKIECPLITQEVINRLIQYALDTNWGKKNTGEEKELPRKLVEGTQVV
ncbi:MAG: NAD-dependent epimerase/dehydratase family protein [Candidatus Brocadia sp.]|nr:NAD-dependent epimerase/dehydratase family protein [Candidatus Brocadia sp.]